MATKGPTMPKAVKAAPGAVPLAAGIAAATPRANPATPKLAAEASS